MPHSGMHFGAKPQALFAALATPCTSCCCGAVKLDRTAPATNQPQSFKVDLLFILNEAAEAIPFNYLEVFLFVQNIFLCMFSTEK